MSDTPTTSYDGPSFGEAEFAGWQARAGTYDELLGTITRQAVAPLLDAAGVGTGTRVLDVACGPGYAAAVAAERGAEATGLDIAPNMVAEAKRNFPGVEFGLGKGEALPFDDGAFDAVVCNFGIMHMPDPDKALAEAMRVLDRGGRYALTVWPPPDKHPFMGLVAGAIKVHGRLDVAMPPAPDFNRFAEAEECDRALRAAGFSDVQLGDIDLAWRTAGAEVFVTVIEDSTVRTAMLLEHQTPDDRERIRRAIIDGAEAYKTDGGYEIGWPAIVVSATR